MNWNIIAYNNREKFTFIEIIAIKKNVISYEVDKDLLRDETLKDNL